MTHPSASNPHRTSVLQALLVTFLWSTSWVLIKIGLQDIPALSFAGLRYTLAFLCLLPLVLRPTYRPALRRLTRRQWSLLIGLGLIFYTIVQGAQFVGLAYLPAANVNVILSFTSVIVALMGLAWLNERPGRLGWTGIALSILGALVFFYPAQFPRQEIFGMGVAVVGMIANAFGGVLGRRINAREGLPPLLVTTVSMGIGGLVLLVVGGVLQGIPRLDLTGLAIIAWLAVVNTALAFTLWNASLRHLSAMESALINNTMTVQIAILAWVFLGEALTVQKIIGMLLAVLGVMVVQLRRPAAAPAAEETAPLRQVDPADRASP